LREDYTEKQAGVNNKMKPTSRKLLTVGEVHREPGLNEFRRPIVQPLEAVATPLPEGLVEPASRLSGWEREPEKVPIYNRVNEVDFSVGKLDVG
jgi:hypothetical protein